MLRLRIFANAINGIFHKKKENWNICKLSDIRLDVKWPNERC